MIDIRNCDCQQYLRELPEGSVDLIVTDPPYLLTRIDGGGTFGTDCKTHYKECERMKDGIPPTILHDMMRVLKTPNLYVWGNWTAIQTYLDVLEEYKVHTNLLCWHKTNPIPTCCNKYLPDTEYCLYARRKVPLYGGYAEHRTYWIEPINTKDKKLWNHPTIKPLGIIKQLIGNSSEKGQTVLDPFLGSGTTAVACKQLERNFIGCEIDPTYYATALRRLEEQ